MRYIKLYEEFRSKEYRMMSLPSSNIDKNKSISIFNQDWFEKLLPNQLVVLSDPKLSKLNKDQSITDLKPNKIVFDKNECTIDSDMIQFSYYYNSMVDGPNGSKQNMDGATSDSEPALLEFDIHFTKNKRGIKLIVNITYGDQVESEFSIESPNKINIISYNGVGSKYDSEAHWGFSKESIKDLVNFFNSFNHGIKLKESDLSFIDEDRKSYKHIDNNTDHLYNDDSNLIDFENSIKESFNGNVFLVINNTKPPQMKYLPKVIDYLKTKDINFIVANTISDIVEYKQKYNIIGAISTGSDFSVIDSNPTKFELNEFALSDLDCPILAICYGFQSMSKFYGQEIESSELNSDDLNLTFYDKDHFLFDGIDLEKQKVKFCFHDYPSDIPVGFDCIAKLGDIIAGISNSNLERYGILFHPEEMTETYTILDNFVKHCK